MTRELIDHLPISSWLHRTMLAAFLAHQTKGSNFTEPLSNDPADTTRRSPSKSPLMRAATHGSFAPSSFAPSPLTSVYTTLIANASSGGDIAEDREPTVTVMQNNVGAFFTVVANIQFSGSVANVVAVKSLSLTAFTAAPLQYTTPNNWTGYEQRGDPVLGHNPYADPNGYRPTTIYAGAVMTHYVGSNPSSSGIGIWTMDPNAGSPTWNQVQLVSPLTYPHTVDKPSLTVSLYPSRLGTVYLAFVDVQVGTNTTIKVFADQKNVGWGPLAQIPNSTGTNYTCPQVMVDPANGYIYVTWLDWTTQRLFVTRSTDGGNSWATPLSTDMTASPSGAHPILTNQLINGVTPDDLLYDFQGKTIQARTMITARFNRIDHSIGVVWHRREGSSHTGLTDCVYIRFIPSTVWTSSTFGSISVATNGASSANDQWNPGLDYNDNGQYMVTYYSRFDDPALNRRYKFYASKLNADGTIVSTTPLYNTLMANPTPTPPAPQFTGLGEYKDVWYCNTTWYGAFEYIPDRDAGGSGQSDSYLTDILP